MKKALVVGIDYYEHCDPGGHQTETQVAGIETGVQRDIAEALPRGIAQPTLWERSPPRCQMVTLQGPSATA